MKKFLLSMAAVAACFTMQAQTVTDVLTVDNFGFTQATQYKDVTYTSTTTGITYTGNMCKANSTNGDCMQFRSTAGKESGLIIGANPNGYKLVSIKVENSAKASTKNQWDVYGKTTAYTGYKDLYTAATAGTLVGNGTETATLTSDAGYTFIGLRPNKNAIYLTTITLTYEAGGAVDPREPAGLQFPKTVYTVTLGEDFEAPALSKQTDAAPEFSSSKPEVATVNATTGAVTIVGEGTTVITAKTAETEDFHAGEASYTLTVKAPVANVEVALAKAMGSGKYIIACEKGVAKNYTGSAAYGYVYIDTEFVPAAGAVKCPETYLYTFTATDKGYTIQGANGGKYYGMDASHFGSFNYYETPDADGSNCYWDVTIDADGNAKIANKGREGAYLSWKAYNNDFEIVTTDKETATLQLYTNTQLGVDGIAADNDAEGAVEYYNMQGVRVANPENGLYIRVQGKKATKVLVK